MISESAVTISRMLESLPEQLKDQVVEHVREYIADLQDKDAQHVKKSDIWEKCLWVVSPTYAVTLCCKEKWGKKGIKTCTSVYLTISFVLFFIVLALDNSDSIRYLWTMLRQKCNDCAVYFYLFLLIFSYSRIIEILVALPVDTLSFLDSSILKNSNFTIKEMVLQLIKNYIDITIKFCFTFYHTFQV